MAKNKFKPFALLICPELDALRRINSNDLVDLQGNLKDLSEKNYKRLRESIKRYGFMIPLFVWFDPADGTGYTLDGNQRLRFIHLEYPEGVMLPYVPIAALDAAEAKEKILLISSNYGETTKEGFDEFIGSMGNYESISDFVKDVTTFGEFLEKLPEPIDLGETGPVELSYRIEVECSDIVQREELARYLLERGYAFSML